MMDAAIYLTKAEQCLAGAALAVRHGQYNNAANRAYYAAFQAAIAALSRAGVQPSTPRYWAHDFVLREYCARLARPHGAYPPQSAPQFKALQDERLKADYEVELLSRASGERALALAQEFVAAVRQRLGEEVACRPSVRTRSTRSSR
ncbi:MAG TPA: HEPN domain-containing protein [Chloroflexota bacterium]|nr:HEPN domain-containing protein [Chloroflexota bacterium]